LLLYPHETQPFQEGIQQVDLRTLSRWNILAELAAPIVVHYQQIKRQEKFNLTAYNRQVLKTQVNLNLNPKK